MGQDVGCQDAWLCLPLCMGVKYWFAIKECRRLCKQIGFLRKRLAVRRTDTMGNEVIRIRYGTERAVDVREMNGVLRCSEH